MTVVTQSQCCVQRGPAAAAAAAGSHLISVASHRSLACTRSRVRATGGRAFVALLALGFFCSSPVYENQLNLTQTVSSPLHVDRQESFAAKVEVRCNPLTCVQQSVTSLRDNSGPGPV